MNQKVSIIVPIYNVETYLRECLESIVNQTYKNIEIILVNDGSTDGSYSICEEYKRKDSRIVLLSQKNSGLSAARNIGLKEMTGDWVTFVDSDDVISINMIEDMIMLCIENVDVAICKNIKFVDKILHEERQESIEWISNIKALENLYTSNQECFITAWGKLYKSELFKGINFPEKKIHEDVFTTYKLYGVAKNVVYTSAPYYYYRQRQGSITNSDFTIQKFDLLEGLFEMMNYVLQLPSFSKEINVVGEFLEKLIFFYEKSSIFENDIGKNIKKKLMEEHRILLKKHWKKFSKKEKLKFLIFSICPKWYFLLRNVLKG